MKKTHYFFKGLFIFLVLLCLVGLQSCKNDQVLKRTDMYYTIVKAIILEPEINSLLSASEIKILKKIDITYKTARRLAKKNSKDISDPLRTILACGVDVITLLDILDVSSLRREEIAAIRIGIKILMASLPEPGEVTTDIE